MKIEMKKSTPVLAKNIYVVIDTSKSAPGAQRRVFCYTSLDGNTLRNELPH